MPREIVTVQVGQCGNQMGHRFWELLLREHAANNEGGCYDEALSSLFRNVEAGTSSRGSYEVGLPVGDGSGAISALRARAVLVDTEEGVVSQMLRSPIAELYDRRQILTDISGAGNNWAHGHEVYGPKHREGFLERVRYAVEQCESLQCFSLLHSMGGGTGSGLGSYCLHALSDAFPRTERFTTAVFPSAEDDVITSPYNSLLATHQLIEHSDVVLPVENAALIELVKRAQQPQQAVQHAITENSASGVDATRLAARGKAPAAKAFDSMNNIVAHTLSALTASVRFPGALNTDLSDISSNLVPFPRMHFLIPGFAPLYSVRDLKYQPARIDALFTDVLSAHSQLVCADVRHSRFLACGLLLRGDVVASEAQRALNRLRPQLQLCHWNPDSFKLGLCATPPVGQPHACLALSNNCITARVLRNLLSRFGRLYKRKAHAHHFTEYMESSRFDEAKEAAEAVAQDYETVQAQQPSEHAQNIMDQLITPPA